MHINWEKMGQLVSQTEFCVTVEQSSSKPIKPGWMGSLDHL